jgi:hypothetical protein
MANAYADGNFVNPVLVSNVVSYPYGYPSNSNVAEFALEYVQTLANYTELPLGSATTDAPSCFLIQKGPKTRIAPGFIRYPLLYSQKPVDWVEKQQVAYTFPGLSGPPVPNANTFNPYYYRAPITLFSNATVYHNYSTGATAPNPDQAFQSTDGNNVVDYIGVQNPNIGAGSTDPSVEPGTYIVSSSITQIRPLIWEKTTVTVPKPT